ncbi:MAG: hypothetical protein OEV31_01195, partial [Gammaproteobacteria bacterium]|nr:hypothetical protein [Gammaproteobacteria bacterium]
MKHIVKRGVEMRQKHHPRRGAVRLLQFSALAFLAGMPWVVNALGLGRFIVSSGLDEPLNARIELVAPTAQ